MGRPFFLLHISYSFLTPFIYNMYNAKELLEKVNLWLEKCDVKKGPDGLYAPISYVLSLGGKRIRPVMVLMAYNLYKDDVEKAIMPALGLETYHNFTLLHDDLMDRADVRRGKATVHKKWNDNTAILSGDNMLVMAMQRVAMCDVQYLPEIISLFTKTAIEIDEGQQYDMDFETRNDVTEAEYLEMIRLKTSVLLACALKMGAILGGAPAADAESLYGFGEKIGLAFQLQDDFLDVYGDFETFGKKIGGDIMCNKKTYMLINAQLRAQGTQAEELSGWIQKVDADPEEKVPAVTRIYTELGIPELCQQRINEYFDEALACLDRVQLPAERKQMLRNLALQLLNRKS